MVNIRMTKQKRFPDVIELRCKSHFSAFLDWSSALLQYKFTLVDEENADNIYALLQKFDGHEPEESGWNNVYMGTCEYTVLENLYPMQEYYFRIRFHENKNEFTSWSPLLNLITNKEPYYETELLNIPETSSLQDLVNSSGYKSNNLIETAQTPLMITAKQSLLDLMDMLLSFKADVGARDVTGKTALMHATFHGQLKAVRTLVKHNAKFKDTDLAGCNAIHYAVDSLSIELLNWIFKNNADVNSRDENAGWTPLIRSIMTATPEVTLALIENGANINSQDNDGRTALMLAVMNNDPQMVDLLLKNGANVNIVNANLKNAVEIAKANDNEELLKLFEFYSKHTGSSS